MLKTLLKSKLHRINVTQVELDYEGSCEIDIALLRAANICPYEQIDIYDISNGERLSTYAIPGKPESGIIAVNGAACHKINVNDQIIICTYCMLKDNEYVNHKPTIIYVDESNNIIEKPVNKKINAV